MNERVITTRKGERIIVDAQDYESLAVHTWHVSSWGYAVRFERANGKKICIRMHRQLLGLSLHDGKIVDHINRNPLDNRRGNLRLCTSGQNGVNTGPRSHNRLGVKGVQQHYRKFQARITINGRRKFLGMFATAEEASEFFELASALVYGEFAPCGRKS